MSKFCANCGNEMDEADNVCSNCGKPASGKAPNVNAPVEGPYQTYAIVSLVCGICSIVLCWFYWVLALICLILGIVAIVFAIKAKKGGKNGLATGGLVTGIIGVVMSVLVCIGFAFISCLAVRVVGCGIESIGDLINSVY